MQHKPMMVSLFVVLAFLASVGGAPVHAETLDAPNAPPNDLLQFTAGGHVLGFQPNAIYFAGTDHALKVEFVGSEGVNPVAGDQLLASAGAAALDRVTYPNVWDGITVIYEADAGGIAKSNYLLDAGAAVERIRLRYHAPVAIDSEGNLVVRYATGELRESAPVAWQIIDGTRVPVTVAFQAFELSPGIEATVGFTVGAYDPAAPLVIDPTLEWNTFLGGPGSDGARAIALDGNDNVYVAGDSGATWKGTSEPVRGFTWGMDVFAAKLNPSGVLQWNTFLGGSGNDSGFAIAVDENGNVYVAGYSLATWQGTSSPMRNYSGGYDGFVAQLNSSGALQWNTFLGGAGGDFAYGVALDGAGNIYVTGYGDGTWQGASAPVRGYSGGWDAFVARLNSSGVLQWNAFLGDSGTDYGFAIAGDGTGSTYVTGYSSTSWQGSSAPVRGFTGGADAFVAKLNSSGVLQWNTFLGGASADTGYAIVVDGNGNVYVAGYSMDTWQGSTSPVHGFAGGRDLYAAKLNSSGVLQWNTFLGNTGSEYGYAIAVDRNGNVYLGGYGDATWEGDSAPVRSYTALNDAFVARLNPSGALQWNTFLGGSGTDIGNAIAFDSSGNVYMAGGGDATWQGSSPPVRDHDAAADGFVAKLTTGTTTTVTPSANPSVVAQSVTFTASVGENDPLAATGTVTFYDGTTSLGSAALNGSALATLSTASLVAGSHSITAVYSGDANFSSSTSAVVTETIENAMLYLPLTLK